MSEKTVSDRIFEKFSLLLANDKLFEMVSGDIVASIRLKPDKNRIRDLLRKVENEDSKP